MLKFDMIAFDADDTLWHTERLYVRAQDRFAEILTHSCERKWINERLGQIEARNIEHFGYGIKAFTLSMIETAVDITDGRISGNDIKTILDLAREMLSTEVEMLDGVNKAVAQLAHRYPLMVITKGDLLDREIKVAHSGLGKYFQRIEVVSHKTPESYARLLAEHSLEPQRFFMVGNSLRSDILPVLEIGGSAAYVPYEITWQHETAAPPRKHPGFYQLDHLEQLPALLEQLEQ